MKTLIILLQTQALSNTSTNWASGITDFLSKFGLTDSVMKILGGIGVLIIGIFVAKFITRIFEKLIKKTGVDEKLKGDVKVSSLISKLIYFLLMILVLMTALNILGVGDEVLAPLNDMVSKFMSAIPNILIGGIIIYAGYFLAKIVSEFVEFSGDTIRSFIPKLKLPEDFDLVKLLKTIVFIFIFIPVLIVGLDFLNFEVITEPATTMLGQFMAAIPLILKAVALLAVAIIGGRIIVGLLKDLLSSLKVDSLADKLGIDKILGSTSLSMLIANLVLFFILYLGIIQALEVLQLTQISEILNNIMHLIGKIFFGLLILLIGNVVANFASKMFSSEDSNKFTGSIMKSAIIVIFLAMGLSAMDIADEIINLAFGLGLGAIAVAFALAFGLGGREAAGKELESFFKKFKK